MAKRIVFFVLLNILFIVTISVICSLLGVDRNYTTAQGLDYQKLLIFCAVWGMTGSFLSLMLSRWIAKRALGVVVLDPQSPGEYAWVVQMVHRVAQAAHLPAMPEVGIFDNPSINAFATGPSKSRALVAFSTGLLKQMNQEEIEGVAAHEVAHIQNGDMLTMVLLQGVVNTFVMFFARIIAYAASRAVNEKLERVAWIFTLIVCEIVLGLLALPVICAFSRKREFRADRGSAMLAGREKMIKALEKLKTTQEEEHLPESVAAFGISGKGSKVKNFWNFWAGTHPDLDARIKALQEMKA